MDANEDAKRKAAQAIGCFSIGYALQLIGALIPLVFLVIVAAICLLGGHK
jgi:hypothetical protein